MSSGRIWTAKPRKCGKPRELYVADQVFNHRQIALLGRALRQPEEVFTIKSHQTTHGITYPTAHSDMAELHDRGLLERHKVGKEFRFFAVVEELRKLLEL